MGRNWPVTYLIHNDQELYVGETSSVFIRMNQHFKNPDRRFLIDADENRNGKNTIHIIYSPAFNKSVILDLESTLIAMMGADRKFDLKNKNSGQKTTHDYYNKGWYDSEIFPQVWQIMLDNDLALHDYGTIVNSDLFKFSPYRSLTEEQYTIAKEIIETLNEDLSAGLKGTYMVTGSAGTGKTVLAVYLCKYLIDNIRKQGDRSSLPHFLNVDYSNPMIDLKPDFKIGLVIPQTSLRKTLKGIFKSTPGLKARMVIGPSKVVQTHYDLLIVDEAHRLKRRNALTSFKAFDDNNRRLNLDNEGTELDWILQCSDHQIFFYDAEQSVHAADVEEPLFEKLKHRNGTHYFRMQSQLRVMGGQDYLNYIKKIFSDNPPEKLINFEKYYDFRLYDDFSQMLADIHAKDKSWGLSRMVAGFAWKWKTKNLKDEIYKTDPPLYDFEIEGVKCTWNSEDKDWINSEHASTEIGCLHTVQGYDLNYAGVILGPDIRYDTSKKRIVIDSSHFEDKKVKTEKDPEKLKEFILNTYKVLLTRGIRGTYVYVCNPELRAYLKNYILTPSEPWER